MDDADLDLDTKRDCLALICSYMDRDAEAQRVLLQVYQQDGTPLFAAMAALVVHLLAACGDREPRAWLQAALREVL